MPRLLPLLASLAVLGCDANLSGSYALVSVDGQELPYSFELFGTVTITSGALTLRDSTFEFEVTATDRDGDSEPWTESGTFTLVESNIICFTPDELPPPPPPPPSVASGDTLSSVTPLLDGPASTPAPESTTDCDGRWDGDQITISDGESTAVFRR